MADSNEGSIAWSLLYDKSASLEVYSLEQWKATLHAELTGFTKSYQNGPFYVPPYYYYRGDGFQLYRMDAKTGVTAKFATITQSPRIPWAVRSLPASIPSHSFSAISLFLRRWSG